MIHLAIPARSTRRDAPYTAAGLGDRIHTCWLAWQIGRAHGEPVTFHVDATKMNRPDKVASWGEVLALFPVGSIAMQVHQCQPATDVEWYASLGRDVLTYRYGHMEPGVDVRHQAGGLDAEEYLSREDRLPNPDPEREPDEEPYVTTHFETGGDPLRDKRRVSKDDRVRIKAMYPNRIELRPPHLPLATSAALIANAAAHVGVDSAPMHLAALYLPFSRMHVCTAQARSHHVRRWLANGAREIR